MIIADMLLCLIPVLLVLHKKILETFTSQKYMMIVLSLTLPLIHLFVVGFRWQLVLLYLLHGLLALIAFVLISKSTAYKIGHKGVKRFCSLLLIFTFIFATLFPIGSFPTPTGPYQIGTAHMTYESTTRRELYGKTYDTPRTFVVQFYYPADRIGSRRAPIIENGDVVEGGISDVYNIPSPFVAYLSQLKSNAWYDTTLSENEKQYPVVILSHGWKGFKNIHANLAEELASNGYIVASIDHTYGSLGTVFEDGSQKNINLAALPKRSDSEHYMKYASALVETFKGDILETLDVIEDMNSVGNNSVLSGRNNMEKIAILGHSTGGGAAVKASIEDDRIKAVVGMDAWVEPLDSDIILTGMQVPYLHMRSAAWIGGTNEPNLNMLLASSASDRWLITIERTKHTDFTFVSYLSPVSGLIGLTGKGGKDSVDVQRDLLCSFMDYYVDGKNTKNAIDDIVNKYEDATAEVVYKK